MHRGCLQGPLKVLWNVGKKSLQAWFSRGFVYGGTIRSGGWDGYKFLEGDAFKLDSHVMPRG